MDGRLKLIGSLAVVLLGLGAIAIRLRDSKAVEIAGRAGDEAPSVPEPNLGPPTDREADTLREIATSDDQVPGDPLAGSPVDPSAPLGNEHARKPLLSNGELPYFTSRDALQAFDQIERGLASEDLIAASRSSYALWVRSFATILEFERPHLLEKLPRGVAVDTSPRHEHERVVKLNHFLIRIDVREHPDIDVLYGIYMENVRASSHRPHRRPPADVEARMLEQAQYAKALLR